MIRNLDAFKALIERYNTITLGELQIIEEENPGLSPYDIATKATGFSSKRTCTLCQAVNADCEFCVWGGPNESDEYGCWKGKNTETYDAIENAYDLEELLEAYRRRALYMSIFLEYKDRP